MILIKPSFEVLSPLNGLTKLVEIAGRTCYKSEDKITEESSVDFVKMLIKRGHESVLEHEKITIKFICDRGVSHELVRHRIASFSQESTRYCNYSKDKFNNRLTFIIPSWIELDNLMGEKADFDLPTEVWYNSLLESSRSYLKLLELGWQPQQARAVLPNSLKTEVIVTANLREWRTILKQRTSIASHPQMRELMIPLLDKLTEEVPGVFNDITVGI